MKIKKEYAILFFLMVVLVYYISSEKGGRTHYDLPETGSLDTGEISKIEIQKGDTDLVLVRESGQWLAGERMYPADETLVKTMLDRISGITLTALASESENYVLYDLNEEKRITVTAYKGETVLRTLQVGKPASSFRHTFVLVDDDRRVFHSDGNIRGDFDKSLADVRDRKVMAVAGDVSGIILSTGGETLTIVRNAAPASAEEGEAKTEAPQPLWMTSDGGKVHAAEIEGIVKAFSDLSCDAFLEETEKKDLMSPVYTAVLKGAKSYTLSFFGKKDGKVQATSSESDYPFLLSEWQAERIMKDFSTLVDAGN